MVMKNPPHPGLSVRYDCIEALDLTVTAAAKILSVTRHALSNLISDKCGISAEMSVRLEKAFGASAESWLRLQAAYDLAQVRKYQNDIHVKKVALPKDYDRQNHDADAELRKKVA